MNIVYDTVSKLKWSADIRAHRIPVVIEQLLSKDWEEGQPLPKAEAEEDCIVSVGIMKACLARNGSELPSAPQDCYSWEYGDYKNATSSS